MRLKSKKICQMKIMIKIEKYEYEKNEKYWGFWSHLSNFMHIYFIGIIMPIYIC